MNILVIETSSPCASLCVAYNGDLLFSSSWEAERNHDAHLFPALQRALRCLHGQNLDIVLVGAGPGSYGGVRVALAAAEGIALVHGAQVAAINSWLGLPLPPGPCTVISDAKRGGWAAATFQDGLMDGTLTILSQPELSSLLENAEGRSLSVEHADHLRRQGIAVDRPGVHATAEALLRAWLRLGESEQRALLETSATPVYVRPPHITQAKRKPWES